MNTKRFVVRDDMINDWPGTRFTTTNRCFGRPCKEDVKEHKYGLFPEDALV